MQGMMVTLLFVSLACPVIAQQPNPQTVGPQSQFTLTLSDEYLDQLRSVKAGLRADVLSEVKDGNLHEILLRYETDAHNMHNHQIIENNPNRYNLWIDEARIRLLKNNPDGLVADVPAPLNDVIKQIRLKYQAPNAMRSTRRPMSPTPEPDSIGSVERNSFNRSLQNQIPVKGTPSAENDFAGQRTQFGDFTNRTPSLDEQLESIRKKTAQSQSLLYGPRYYDEDNRYPSPGPVESNDDSYVIRSESILPGNNREVLSSRQQPSSSYPSASTYPPTDSGFRPRIGTTDQTKQYSDPFPRTASNRSEYSQSSAFKQTAPTFEDVPIRGPATPVVQDSSNGQSEWDLQAELIRRENERLKERIRLEQQSLARKKTGSHRS